GVVLKLIQVKDIGGMDELDQGDQMVELVKRSIIRIFDEENVYEASETSDSDLNDFIENLSFGQLELLGGFFDSVPKLKKEIEFKCNLCESVQTRMLEGLQSFF
ncbi:uncharacterized protein METZ01_LOCUS268311, partial [marine metagenome]